tara:strand:- start:50 stop:541 length:492 start_codon:yes stop_codon:yes gene_type:complete
MASANLTGQNIQDTYQRLLQLSSSGEIADGTGSLAAITSISASLTGSFGRVICTSITASTGDFDADTIRIGGTSFSKTDLDTLKSGGSINTVSKDIQDGESSTNIVIAKGYVSPSNNNTLIKMGNNVLGIYSERTSLNGNVTASSNISASGDIYFNKISGGTF